MAPYLASMLALPVLLASASNLLNPAASERQARHRDLARHHTELDRRDVHPVLGRRTLEPRAAQVPLGGFEVVGNSGVSAQMMFLGTAETVFILDSASPYSLMWSTADPQKPKTTHYKSL